MLKWLRDKYQQWQARRLAARLDRLLRIQRALDDIREDGLF